MISKINPKYANVLKNEVNTTEFSLLIAEHIKFPTPDTFTKAITSKLFDKCKLAMVDEIQLMA